jgi:CheY-like chemotaxis protein
MKILVIEDDPTVGEFVRRGLEEQRWQADLVANGLEGERLALAQAYDLVILDMRLPGRNGLDVLRTLRARGFERPVLVLTAQDAVDAKVETLRAGADDYVTKPFAFEELLARAEALLRRPRAMASPQLRVGDLALDQGTREVRRGEELIDGGIPIGMGDDLNAMAVGSIKPCVHLLLFEGRIGTVALLLTWRRRVIRLGHERRLPLRRAVQGDLDAPDLMMGPVGADLEFPSGGRIDGKRLEAGRSDS